MSGLSSIDFPGRSDCFWKRGPLYDCMTALQPSYYGFNSVSGDNIHTLQIHITNEEYHVIMLPLYAKVVAAVARREVKTRTRQSTQLQYATLSVCPPNCNPSSTVVLLIKRCVKCTAYTRVCVIMSCHETIIRSSSQGIATPKT